jgi:hypothetical protein
MKPPSTEPRTTSVPMIANTFRPQHVDQYQRFELWSLQFTRYLTDVTNTVL